MRSIERERHYNIWMGNYKFRVWDMMMPNSWFYKLKDMTIIRRRRNHKKEPSSTNNSPILVHSHHFTLSANLEPPRKSSKGKPRRRPSLAARTSPSSRTALQSVTTTAPQEEDAIANAVISPKKVNNGSDEDQLKSSPTQIDLPPIITRSPSSSSNAVDGSTCISKKEPRSIPSRRFPVNSQVRIVNSPRVSSKRFGRRKSGGKRSLSDSLAIVKSTKDPERDFRESMVEMIVENKMSASNELEDLLACYLSLNTHEYHDIIVKVFKQIWFDMTDIGVH